MTSFACGGIILLSLYFQICNIVNILPTSANTYNYSPYQVLMGRGAKLQDMCPHRPLETVLVAKHNEVTNRTSNKNMCKAIFLYAKNTHMQKDKPEFEYLTLDTMEIITRGEGIPFEADAANIDRINDLANTETSQIYCPLHAKIKTKRKQERHRKQLPAVDAGVMTIMNRQPCINTDKAPDRETLENLLLATPTKNPTPITPGTTLGELLQSAPVIGK